jgi:hypothetical protein
MRKTKLVTGLISLNHEELKSYKKYVQQRCGIDSDVNKIFEIFYNKREDLDQVDIEKIRTKYFSRITTKVFSNHMSTLFQWFEDWLVIEELYYEKFDYDLYLLKALNRRGLYNLANISAENLETKLQSLEKMNIKKTFVKAKMNHYMMYSNNPIKQEKGNDFIANAAQYHLEYALEQALVYETELHNWGVLNRVDYSAIIANIHQVCKVLPATDISKELEKINQFFLTRDLDTLLNFREQVFNNFDIDSELHTFYTLYIIIFSNKLWSANHLKDKQIILENYNYAMEEGVFLKNNKIGNSTFNNIVGAIGQVASYKITEEFIDNWINLVETNNRHATYHVASAINCFYHDMYSEIPKHTYLKNFGTIEQELRALFLYHISCFIDRKNETEVFILNAKKLTLFLEIKQGEISELQFLQYINLLNLLNKINKTKDDNVVIDIDDYLPIPYKSWCIEMLKNRRQ